jgi:hypothetical protein
MWYKRKLAVAEVVSIFQYNKEIRPCFAQRVLTPPLPLSRAKAGSNQVII